MKSFRLNRSGISSRIRRSRSRIMSRSRSRTKSRARTRNRTRTRTRTKILTILHHKWLVASLSLAKNLSPNLLYTIYLIVVCLKVLINHDKL